MEAACGVRIDHLLDDIPIWVVRIGDCLPALGVVFADQLVVLVVLIAAYAAFACDTCDVAFCVIGVGKVFTIGR